MCIDQDGSSIECQLLETTENKTSSGKNRRNISIEAKKWVSKMALELCSPIENFNILEKRIDVLEIDETPAFGLEPKIKMGVNGVVECI